MPKCNAMCEVYSRVVGYLRPVQNWNIGKKEEFRERVDYEIKAEVKKSKANGLAIAPHDNLKLSQNVNLVINAPKPI